MLSGVMEKIQFLTHDTNQSKKEHIQKEGFLRGNRERDSRFSEDGLPLRRQGAPTGVWFAVSLFQGDLPTYSPFGPERLKVTIEDICIDSNGKYTNLFLEGTVSCWGFNCVRLIMCPVANEWICHKDLQPLDISNNDYLTLDREHGNHVVVNSASKRTYVHVFVPCDTLELGDWEWESTSI